MEHLFGLTGDERSDDEGKNHKFEKSHEELPGIGDVDDGERVQVVRSEDGGSSLHKHEDMLGEFTLSHLRQIPRMMPRLTPEKVKARSRFLATQVLSWSLRAFCVPGFILK